MLPLSIINFRPNVHKFFFAVVQLLNNFRNIHFSRGYRIANWNDERQAPLAFDFVATTHRIDTPKCSWMPPGSPDWSRRIWADSVSNWNNRSRRARPPRCQDMDTVLYRTAIPIYTCKWADGHALKKNIMNVEYSIWSLYDLNVALYFKGVMKIVFIFWL